MSSSLLPSRGLRRTILTLLIAGMVSAGVAAEPGALSEYHLKAAFLYNFAKFIEWPAQDPPSQNTAFVIGVIGSSPLRNILDQVVRGKTIGNRPVVVKRIEPEGPLGDCQIIFVPRSQTQHLATILAAAASQSVLTVGETEQFEPCGGMINFYLEKDRVRFEVNPEAAAKAGLRISAKLLGVGKVYKPASHVMNGP